MTMEALSAETEVPLRMKKLVSFDRMSSGSTCAGHTPLSDLELVEEAPAPQKSAFGLEAIEEIKEPSLLLGEPRRRAAAQLSKPSALALQNELLAAYTSARFQKKLQAMARQQGVAKSGVHEPEFQEALKSLLRKPQMEIISRYGFRASREGIEEMQLELRLLEEDGDIYVNRVAIEEALLGPFEDLTQEVEPHSGQPSTKQGVYLLLRSLFLGFSEAWFQEALVKLQLKKDKAESRNAQARPDPDGYFHLPGRAELALEVHQKILPRFGFDATKEGVSDMIRHCAGFLQDPEVANLFDAINRKLGMSPSACVRFRRCCYDLRQPPWPAAMAAQPSGGACHLVHIR